TASIRTWRFRSAPGLPSGGWSPRNSARDPARHICDARRPVDMWDNARALPHLSTGSKTKTKWLIDSLETGGAHPQTVGSHTPARPSYDTAPDRCAICTRLPTAIHTG